MLGMAVGTLLGGSAMAPATWTASAVESLTQGRIRLLEPEGTVWSGSAQLALQGGPDSLDRMALAQRMQWRWSAGTKSPSGWGLKLRMNHPQALPQPLELHLMPRWTGASVQLGSEPAGHAALLRLPAAWLCGLGTPWNTLQPGGELELRVDRLQIDWSRESPPSMQVQLRLRLNQMASRISTLPVLGSYEMQMESTEQETSGLRIRLSSLPHSALVLDGIGRWIPGQRVEFRGQAQAAAGHEAALANLLNIIGRRDGARSIIAL